MSIKPGITPQEIKSIRKIFRWSQAKMAKKLKVSNGTVAQWELGNTPSGPAIILLNILRDSSEQWNEIRKDRILHLQIGMPFYIKGPKYYFCELITGIRVRRDLKIIDEHYFNTQKSNRKKV